MHWQLGFLPELFAKIHNIIQICKRILEKYEIVPFFLNLFVVLNIFNVHSIYKDIAFSRMITRIEVLPMMQLMDKVSVCESLKEDIPLLKSQVQQYIAELQ